MPHIVMEYAQELEQKHDIRNLLNVIHDAAKSSQLFTANSIKSRAIPYSYYRIAEGGQDYRFIHTTIYLLKGRTSSQKHQLSQLVCQAICSELEILGSISVDVRDLDEETYIKRGS